MSTKTCETFEIHWITEGLPVFFFLYVLGCLLLFSHLHVNLFCKKKRKYLKSVLIKSQAVTEASPPDRFSRKTKI